MKKKIALVLVLTIIATLLPGCKTKPTPSNYVSSTMDALYKNEPEKICEITGEKPKDYKDSYNNELDTYINNLQSSNDSISFSKKQTKEYKKIFKKALKLIEYKVVSEKKISSKEYKVKVEIKPVLVFEKLKPRYNKVVEKYKKNLTTRVEKNKENVTREQIVSELLDEQIKLLNKMLEEKSIIGDTKAMTIKVRTDKKLKFKMDDKDFAKLTKYSLNSKLK